MSDRPPIPADAWEKLTGFLAAGKTGQIQLDVKEGRVLSGKFIEAWRCEEQRER